MPAPLKSRISDDMKSALRAGDKARLGAIRLMLAAIKQREIDTRTELSDTDVLSILDKMIKQRRDSITQYRAARRDDLAAAEEFELELIRGYMPTALSDAEIDALIEAALAETGAASVRDMGKVMSQLRPRVQGRADMAAVSKRVNARLAGR